MCGSCEAHLTKDYFGDLLNQKHISADIIFMRSSSCAVAPPLIALPRSGQRRHASELAAGGAGDGFCLDYSAVGPKGGRGGVWAWPSATRAIRSFAEMIDRPGCRRGRGGGSGAGPSAARAIRSFSQMIYQPGCRREGRGALELELWHPVF